MNKIISLLSVCFACSLPAYSSPSSHHHHPEHHDHHDRHHHYDHHCDEEHHFLSFDVNSQNYTFSTVFDFMGRHDYLGTAVKSVFHLRTHYDLYGVHGEYEGTGICRVLTLGAIYNWGREIDIWGPDGDYVGMIDGQFATEAKAKYSIYNGIGTRVGIAYLEKGSSAFTIVNPHNEFHRIAYLRRNFIPNETDYWSAVVYDEDAIDLRIIKVFAAFALDSQNSFKEDL